MIYFVCRAAVQTISAAEKGRQSGRQSNNDCLLHAAWPLRVGPLHALPSRLVSHTSVLSEATLYGPAPKNVKQIIIFAQLNTIAVRFAIRFLVFYF